MCLALNESFHDFVKETLNVEKNTFFTIKPDAYYARYVQWGVKKRYAYVDYDGKHGYRGVEMRRSSTPQVVKTVQQSIFDCILGGGESADVARVVRQSVEVMLDPEQTPDIDFGQPFGIKKPGTSAHNAAMWSNDNIGTTFDIGDKPCIVFARSAPGNLPHNRRVAIEWGEDPGDYDVVVDRDLSIQTFFANSNSFAAILGALGTTWARCMSGVGQDTLEKWFG